MIRDKDGEGERDRQRDTERPAQRQTLRACLWCPLVSFHGFCTCIDLCDIYFATSIGAKYAEGIIGIGIYIVF